MYIQGICLICGKEITQMEQLREIKDGVCHSKCVILPKRRNEDDCGANDINNCNMDYNSSSGNETRRNL